MSAEQADAAALRMRDVDGQFFGIGAAIPGLAERAGTTPGEMARRIASLPDDQMHDLVKDAIHEVQDNGEDVRKAQEDGRSDTQYRIDAASLDAFFGRWSHLIG